MPNYQDHLLLGAIISVVAIYLLSPFIRFTPEIVVGTAFFILLGSVFPDVDHQNSVVHRYTKAFLSLFVGSLGFYAMLPKLELAILSGASSGIATFLLFQELKPRHRKVTHTKRGAIGFYILVSLFSVAFLGSLVPGIFALIAYSSHLVLDRIVSSSS
ncbi:MAG: metal-dependent hydrolase [Candidatus Nanohaloarchaeota archaeon QJJ-9]|nr:metal-dependent hydrolase [Candidatus Nanohaloarchaeota archaeon QJJ-9]